MSIHNFRDNRDNVGIGVIDPVTGAAIIETATNFIKSFIGGDKVPNYPVKSTNTFNSIKASIQNAVPLPPANVEDAKRLLQLAINERALSVARGNDVGTQTAIMLWDEWITALKNYIATGGQSGGAVPGSGGTTQQLPYKLPDTFPTKKFYEEPLFIAGAAVVAVYFLTRKKGRR